MGDVTDAVDAGKHHGYDRFDYVCEPARPNEFESLEAQAHPLVTEVVSDA